MHATGRANGRHAAAAYTPLHTSTRAMTDDDSYWYWRRSESARDEHTGDVCIDLVYTVDGRTHRCSATTAGGGARVANALNRAYGHEYAPRFDERTGLVVEQ